MYIFRITGFVLLINYISIVCSDKSHPLKVLVSQWSDKAPPIYYLKGDTTEPLYRLEKEPADDSILLVDEQKETVIGRTTGLAFKIFNTTTQKWISGRIQSHFRLFGYKVTIIWNGIKITMIGGKTRTFYDSKNKMIARCIISSMKKQYELEIWSDYLPETVYILALASHTKSHE